jgi:hypothetical protein
MEKREREMKASILHNNLLNGMTNADDHQDTTWGLFNHHHLHLKGERKKRNHRIFMKIIRRSTLHNNYYYNL